MRRLPLDCFRLALVGLEPLTVAIPCFLLGFALRSLGSPWRLATLECILNGSLATPLVRSSFT